ncbi:MAG: hypothetical protein AAF581_15955 [Planctomycetota bacterium]
MPPSVFDYVGTSSLNAGQQKNFDALKGEHRKLRNQRRVGLVAAIVLAVALFMSLDYANGRVASVKDQISETNKNIEALRKEMDSYFTVFLERQLVSLNEEFQGYKAELSDSYDKAARRQAETIKARIKESDNAVKRLEAATALFNQTADRVGDIVLAAQEIPPK